MAGLIQTDGQTTDVFWLLITETTVVLTSCR